MRHVDSSALKSGLIRSINWNRKPPRLHNKEKANPLKRNCICYKLKPILLKRIHLKAEPSTLASLKGSNSSH